MALKVKALNRPPEGRISRVQFAVHLGREACRYIPVVRLGKNMRSTTKADISVPDILRRPHIKPASNLIGWPLIASDSFSGDMGRRSKTMRLAPAIEGKCCTVVAQQLGIQRLQKGESF